MAVRKSMSFSGRVTALGYGIACIVAALLIAQIESFAWSAGVAFVVGLFGVGGIVRCLLGYDEL